MDSPLVKGICYKRGVLHCIKKASNRAFTPKTEAKTPPEQREDRCAKLKRHVAIARYNQPGWA